MTKSSSLFILMALLALTLLYVTQPPVLIIDEFSHVSQIDTLIKGEDTHLPQITTFIFIHHIYAELIDIFSLTNPLDYRFFNYFICILLIWVLTRICNSKKGDFDTVLAAQLFFLPIALPYYPLIYTDIIALVFIYTAYFFFQQNSHWRATLFLTAAVLVRQPSLVWLGLFATITYFNQFDLSTIKQGFKQLIKPLIKLIPYVLSIGLFLTYFYLNKGVALGDKGSHKLTINITNVYFMVLVFFVVFFPLLVTRINCVLSLLSRHLWMILILVILLPVYVLTFEVTHQYNTIEGYFFLRNALLKLITEHLSLQIIAYLVSVFTVLALSTIKLKQTVWNWLYLFLPLAVIAMPLIEQRYYIVGMALWQLSRNKVIHSAEVIQLIWMVLFSMFLYFGVSFNWFYI